MRAGSTHWTKYLLFIHLHAVSAWLSRADLVTDFLFSHWLNKNRWRDPRIKVRQEPPCSTRAEICQIWAELAVWAKRKILNASHFYLNFNEKWLSGDSITWIYYQICLDKIFFSNACCAFCWIYRWPLEGPALYCELFVIRYY